MGINPVIILVGVVCGIVLQHSIGGGIYTSLFIFITGVGASAVMMYSHNKKALVMMAVFFLFMIVGQLRLISVLHTDYSFVDTSKGVQRFTGKIIREPDRRSAYTNLTIKTDIAPYNILVTTKNQSEFHYGDSVAVRGRIQKPENFYGNSGKQFNYVGYLSAHRILFVMKDAHVSVAVRAHSLYTKLLTVKEKYLYTLQRLLNEPYAALAGGITVGDKRSLGKTLTEQFREAGLIHIVVLSGYNISIIIVALSFMLLWLPRALRMVAIIFSIFIFTIFVGPSATVVRAALMGALGAVGMVSGRTYSAMYGLLWAGIMMLLYNPLTLLYDPSFQLSFMATLGLLLGSGFFMKHLIFIPQYMGLRAIIAATLSTQIAVAPLIVYMMGTLSLVAVFVNIVVLPIIPLAMLTTFLTGAVGMVSYVGAIPFAFVTNALLLYVVWIVQSATDIPFASVQVHTISLVGVFLLYGVIALWWATVYKDEAGDAKSIS